MVYSATDEYNNVVEHIIPDGMKYIEKTGELLLLTEYELQYDMLKKELTQIYTKTKKMEEKKQIFPLDYLQ